MIWVWKVQQQSGSTTQWHNDECWLMSRQKVWTGSSILLYSQPVNEERVTMSAAFLSLSCVWSRSSSLWQEHEEPQSGLLACFVSLVPDVYRPVWRIRRLNEWLNLRRFQFMFICLFNYSHSSATHDIMENFVGSRSAEGNAGLLSLLQSPRGYISLKIPIWITGFLRYFHLQPCDASGI